VSNYPSWPTPTWLSNKYHDPNELVNLVAEHPLKVQQMQAALKETLLQLKAPQEQLIRLGINQI
jgi:hypothetical protein